MGAALDRLFTHDLSNDIDRLPRRPGHQRLPLMADAPAFGTFHYSAVVYPDHSEAAELRTVLAEAKFHLDKNWGAKGQPPIYGDGYMYHAVVLGSGALVKTRRTNAQGRWQALWHCLNKTGNDHSFSLHVPLGPGEDLTEAQAQMVHMVWDALRADYGVPAANIVSHCEWPAYRGDPVRFDAYIKQPGQSACPGPILHRYIAAYRAQDRALIERFTVKPGTTANIRRGPTTGHDKAGKLSGGQVWVGQVVAGGLATVAGFGTSNQWVQASDGRCVWLPLLERVAV